jgi:two-component system, cell cycle response regulator
MYNGGMKESFSKKIGKVGDIISRSAYNLANPEEQLPPGWTPKSAREHGVYLSKEREKQLEALASTDELTGLENRRSFVRHMSAEFNRLVEGIGRANSPRTISIVAIDTDHFKEVNDSHGHQAGDIVLKKIADILRGVVRDGYDHVDRHGGDEWTIGFVNVDQATVLKKMKGLVDKMRGLEIDIGEGRTVKVTFSVGVTTARRGTGARTLEDAMKQADIALYEAKENGRNRVVSWAQPDKNRPGYQHKLDLGV